MREIWGELQNANAEGILALVPPLAEPISVLAVDSSRYLKKLRSKLPAAKIYALTSFTETAELPSLRELDFNWQVADFRRSEFPYEPESFDIILADPCLEFAYEPYDTMLSLNRLLKPTGCVVSQFPNIRYYEVLEGLRQGRFPVQERHFFAKEEVVHLLSDAMYREISFTPLARNEEADVREWESFGFQNFSQDLITEAWMLRAYRSKAEVAALKSLYTKEIRTRLARIIHRIEYDINAAGEVEELKDLCDREFIFPDYLRDFIHETTTHEERVLTLLAQGGIVL